MYSKNQTKNFPKNRGYVRHYEYKIYPCILINFKPVFSWNQISTGLVFVIWHCTNAKKGKQNT